MLCYFLHYRSLLRYHVRVEFSELAICYSLQCTFQTTSFFAGTYGGEYLFSILSPVLLFKRLETADGELVVDVREKE